MTRDRCFPPIVHGIGAQAELEAQASPRRGYVFHGRDGIRTLKLADALDESGAVIAGMQNLGLGQGDRIIVQLPHSPEAVTLLIAALRLGLVTVPVAMNHEARELAYVAKATGANVCFLRTQWRNADMEARAEAVGVKHIVAVGRGTLSLATENWDGLLSTASGQFHMPPVSPQGHAVILFTSGTTSDPKGVIHSHQTLAAETQNARRRMLGADLTGPFFDALPAGHMGGLLSMLRPLFVPMDSLLMETWDVDAALELIRTYKPIAFNGAPFHLSALLDGAAPGTLASLNVATLGATTVPPAVASRAEEAGIRTLRLYGSTEHPTISGSSPDDDVETRHFTDGHPMPGCKVRIVDEDGALRPAGIAGEVLSAGPERFLGYLDSRLDDAAFDADGFFRTGDIGVLDADGRLRIVDRKKDIVIRGGENISSREVEDILCQHPDVAEAAVIGVADARYGEQVGACVRVRYGGQVSLDLLRDHFAQLGVARQKTPEHLFIFDDFPRTPTGKILKTELRNLIAKS